MPETVKLGSTEVLFGDLTGAHLEDHYDAVLVATQVTGIPTREQFSALVTLAHQAMQAAGFPGTRDDVLQLIRFPEAPALAGAVFRALGFQTQRPTPGEAVSP